jgi:hypothetical protein
MTADLEKHIKYCDMYRSNTLYWGLGIENELYFEFDNKIKVTKEKFIENHKRERYSVDYYTAYKVDLLKKAFDYMANNIELLDGTNILLPLLMNSHSLSKTDKKNNSKTLYNKVCSPNIKFDGTTVNDIMFNSSEYLKNKYDVNYIYEGDVIEFITLRFFNTTLENTINELVSNKAQFIKELQDVFKKNNIFPDYGEINFITENHPFSIILTNIANIGIFNNGTLHFNITLPCMLDTDNKIADMQQFTKEHKHYIKLIQYMEPLIISMYGTPDPFSYVKTNKYDETFFENTMFSSCSQRCAVSRYISIGTYDTDTMERGKRLTDKISQFKIATEDYGWYNKYHNTSAYNKLEEIGYDINFNKHYNHGIELRFFDHINNINLIKEAFEFIILLGDFTLANLNISLSNPITNITWNDLVVDCMKYGLELDLNKNYIAMYNNIFNHRFTSKNIKSLYFEIFELLKNRSKKDNMFSKYTLNNKPVNQATRIFYCDV